MAIQSKPFYWVVCDEAECKARCPAEDHEVTAWANDGAAIDEAAESNWLIDGDEHLCPEHSACCDRCDDVVRIGDLDEDDLCQKCQRLPGPTDQPLFYVPAGGA